MIDQNILKSLESNLSDPSYSAVITEFNQKEFCDKDRLEITVEQYNPNFLQVHQNNLNVIENFRDLLVQNDIAVPDINVLTINNCVEKKLIIDSMLTTNDDLTFASKLNGSLTKEKTKALNSLSVEAVLRGMIIDIKKKDFPNIFNRTKFRIKDDNLIISVSKNIDEILVTFEKTDINKTIHNIETFSTVENNKIIIPFEREFVGNKNNFYNIKIDYSLKNDITAQNVESITTPFEKEIKIEFIKPFKRIPAVIPTMDEDKKPYNGYTTHFESDEDNKINKVTIKFKNVKRLKKYDDINITIIGV